MSKLGDAIRRSQRVEAAPMGFGAARPAPKATMLVGFVGPAASLAEATEKGADVVIIDARRGALSKDEAARARPSAGSLPLGVWLSGADEAAATGLREAGVDFLLFDADSTSASALLDDQLGYVLVLPEQPDELFLRSIEPLSLEGLYLEKLPSPLTVSALLGLNRIGVLAHKPVLAKVSSGAGKTDLETLRASGVVLLVLENEADGIGRLKETVLSLPPRRQRREERATIALPRAVVQQPDEDDDDDDDDE